MTRYTDEDHPYNCRCPNDEIRRALVELDKPWRSKRVLEYFHEERRYSTRELARLFGVTRQALQNRVHDFEDFRFSPKFGRSYKVDSEQQTLGDFEGEQSGLSAFI